MTLPKRFLADPDYMNKMLRWVIVVEVLTTIAFAIFMITASDKSSQIVIDPELTKELRKANEDYRQALRKSDHEKVRLMRSLDIRDSVFQVDYLQNLNSVQNERKKYNEKNALIDQYVNTDLQREFAKLTDSIRK